MESRVEDWEWSRIEDGVKQSKIKEQETRAKNIKNRKLRMELEIDN